MTMLVPTHCDWLFLPLLLADSDLLVFTEVQYPDQSQQILYQA